MSLLQYVNEEIDESRGLEYLRRCSNRDLFHSVLAHVWVGIRQARERHKQGELDVHLSFELVYTFPNHKHMVRVKQIVAPPACKYYESVNHSSFLVALSADGAVSGVYKDSLHLSTG